MSSDMDLAAALASAQARLTEKPPPRLLSEPEAHGLLRALASRYGQDPDKVQASFDQGGALADLVRALLLVQPRVRGRRGLRREDHTLRSYLRVNELIRNGHSHTQAVAIHAEEEKCDPGTIKQRWNRWRKRPEVIAAIFGLTD